MARVRRGRRKRPSGRVGGLGSKATSRPSSSRVGGLGSKATSRPSSSHVGSLGSKAGSRSGTIRRSTSRPVYGFRRPRYRRPYGYAYPRRYRARPMSSCGCFAVFIILAIFWLIFLAPSLTGSLVLPIAVVAVLFIVALCFITKLDDDDKDYSEEERVKIIERETVLVVCPYCGAKNEQGVTTCKNCDAEI